MVICYSSKRKLIHATERAVRITGYATGHAGTQGSCVSSLVGVQSWELLRVVVSCARFLLTIPVQPPTPAPSCLNYVGIFLYNHTPDDSLCHAEF